MPRPFSSPLPPDVREKSAARVNEVSLDVLGLAAVARKAHWNISGENFLVLHPFFGSLYDAASEQADKLSEHCSLVLGFPAKGDHLDVAERAAADPLPDDASPDEIPRAVLKASLALLGEIRDAKREVLALGDDDGQQLLLDASIALSKLAGFLAAQIGGDDEAQSEREPAEKPEQA